jgi:hypothetical protein
LVTEVGDEKEPPAPVFDHVTTRPAAEMLLLPLFFAWATTVIVVPASGTKLDGVTA